MERKTVELKEMTGEEAKKILEKVLMDIQTIEWKDLTTFERNLFRKIAKDAVQF